MSDLLSKDKVIENMFDIYDLYELRNADYEIGTYQDFKAHVENNVWEWVYNLTERIKELEKDI